MLTTPILPNFRYVQDPVVKIKVSPGVTKMVSDVRTQSYHWSRELAIGVKKLKSMGVLPYTFGDSVVSRRVLCAVCCEVLWCWVACI